MLYDSRRDRIHVLNETAELIWQYCDGEHTLADIEKDIRANFDVSPDIDVRGDVERAVLSMEKKGLLLGDEDDALEATS